MNKNLIIFLSSIAIAATSIFFTACGKRTQLETCKIIEIEDAEFEVDLGDVDIERGEVEMVCDDKILDVTWGQFRSKLGVDPGNYKSNLAAFTQRVTCLRDESSSKEEVLCKGPKTAGDFATLKFSYDD